MADSTKQVLSASLRKQLHKKPLNRITISDITSDAGLNRMTFYYHFHDIYELVEWSFREEVFRSAVQKVYTPQNWKEGVLEVFQAILDNRSFVLNVYRSLSRERVESHLLRGMRKTMAVALIDQLEKAGISPADQQFITDFYLYGCIGLIMVWIDHEMKDDPSEIVERLARFMHCGVHGLLDSYPAE